MKTLWFVGFYNITLLAGCSYLVFWKDASGWWFLLATILMATAHYRSKCPHCGEEY